MTPANIGYASLTQQAEWIRTKLLSPVEILDAHLQRVQSINPSLKAVVTLADGKPGACPRGGGRLDEGRGPGGTLHGIPFTAKDCFDTAGVRTTRGSRLFKNRIPSRDATAVGRPQAGRSHPAGQDQPSRVRSVVRDLQRGVRPDRESVECGKDGRRLQRRRGCQRLPPDCRRLESAPTWEAPTGYPPTTAAWWASSPPRAAFPSPVSSRR